MYRIPTEIILQRPQAVYLQQSSNQQGRPVQIVQNRHIQPQGGQQVVTSQRVQIIRPGSQQPTQYVVRLTPQQQQQRQQSVQQQGVRFFIIRTPDYFPILENTPNTNSSTTKITTTTSSIPPRSKSRQ